MSDLKNVTDTVSVVDLQINEYLLEQERLTRRAVELNAQANEINREAAHIQTTLHQIDGGIYAMQRIKKESNGTT